MRTKLNKSRLHGQLERMERPDFLFATDLHLGEKQPLCRTDDYNAALWKKVGVMKEIAEFWGGPPVPYLYGGDTFDKAKATPYAIAMAIINLPFGFCVAGQHDLPGHSMDRLPDSALGVLLAAGTVKMLHGDEVIKLYDGKKVYVGSASWGQDFPTGKKYDIFVTHKFVYPAGTPPWPGVDPEADAKKFLAKIPAKTIFTGDNHFQFIYAGYQGKTLVNPGSLGRRRADQELHQPSVWAWWQKDHTVEGIVLPTVSGVITRDHIEAKQEVDEKLSVFISTLNKEYEVGLSFKENMKRFFSKNKVGQEVKEIILTAMEDEK